MYFKFIIIKRISALFPEIDVIHKKIKTNGWFLIIPCNVTERFIKKCRAFI